MAKETFAGLTRTECPIECSAERCLITGRALCGHPHKGGLQGTDVTNAKVMDRYKEARKLVQIADIEQANA